MCLYDVYTDLITLIYFIFLQFEMLKGIRNVHFWNVNKIDRWGSRQDVGLRIRNVSILKYASCEMQMICLVVWETERTAPR